MRTTILTLAAAALLPVGLAAQSPSAIAEGAQVWAANCTRCHNARPSQERTDGQWLTIMLHMRARANLTRSDAEVVTTFLQATNLPETAVVVQPQPVAADPATPEGSGDEETGSPPDLATLIEYLITLSPLPDEAGAGP